MFEIDVRCRHGAPSRIYFGAIAEMKKADEDTGDEVHADASILARRSIEARIVGPLVEAMTR